MNEQPFSNMFQQHHNDGDDFGARYPDPPHNVFTSGAMDMSIPADAFAAFPRASHDVFPATMGFEPALYAEAPSYMLNSGASPGMYPEDGDMRLPSSSLSTASAPSAASSAIGSPLSNHGQMGAVEWSARGLNGQPGIVGNDYMPGSEYSGYAAPGMEEIAFDFTHNKGFVGELPASTPRRLRQPPSVSTPRRLCQPSSVPLPQDRRSRSLYSGPAAVAPSTGETETLHHLPHQRSPSPAGRSPFLLFHPASLESPRTSSTPTPTMFANALPATDPSLINPEVNRPPMAMPYDAQGHFQQQNHPYSPSVSTSPQPGMLRTNSSSPFLHNGPFHAAFPPSPYATPMDPNARRPSMGNFISPTSGEYHSGDETKEKQRCTYPDCGKVFKDLKAHMLTHQNERPEKCPIQTCEYHTKGFARKYDKNRHTLTHYKGTMVCGFCPGSGSAAEKSFNRADVFKRHLTAVHGVEQTPPNSRKKTTSGMNSGKKLQGYAPDATGKCSTCSQTFSNAQDFYEHLDDCVLRIVQQEDPAEAINAQRLAEVEHDKNVHETLEKNNLPTTTQTAPTEEDEEDYDMADEDDDDTSRSNTSPSSRKANPPNGVQKSRGMTHSRGGVALTTKNRGRKSRRDYPSSWGFDKGQMTMKKRVMTVFDGPRRLAKDDMMLSTDCEVRIKLADGKSYITDLDTQTIKRAEGFHNATEEEKGPWISDDPTDDQLLEMQSMLQTN
jgi:hypothetical protein